MSNAAIGYGATFAIGDGGDPETFTAVSEVVSITPPGYSRDAVEATHLQSTDGFKEFVEGMKETTDVELTLNWVPSATDAMITAFLASAQNYKITAPNGVSVTVTGFFTGYTPAELTPDGKQEATATLKVTGKPTWAAA